MVDDYHSLNTIIFFYEANDASELMHAPPTPISISLRFFAIYTTTSDRLFLSYKYDQLFLSCKYDQLFLSYKYVSIYRTLEDSNLSVYAAIWIQSTYRHESDLYLLLSSTINYTYNHIVPLSCSYQKACISKSRDLHNTSLHQPSLTSLIIPFLSLILKFGRRPCSTID